MSKTVKEKAKEWNCSESTVKRYCVSGIIPPAEQVGVWRSWSIPDDWPKPPMTRRSLCYLLDTIYQVNHGVLYEKIKWGFKEAEVKAGYEYLIDAAFMSSIDINTLSETLTTAYVTPRGEELIDKENAGTKGKTRFKAHLRASANIGIASIEVGMEATNEEK